MYHTSVHRIHILAILAAVLWFAGCAGTSKISYLSPQEAYDKGMVEYERGRYDRAAQYFQGVFDFGRTVAIAAEAQLMLARSYRGNKEYILAASEYTRFTELYRTDPREAVAYSEPVSYTHLRAHETALDLVCRLLVE